MFKTVMKQVQVFDLDNLHVGDKIKYMSADEEDKYYDYENDKDIFDWGFGEIGTIDEDEVGVHYFSELNTYVDHNLESVEKEYRFAVLTPDMILNEGYVLERVEK